MESYNQYDQLYNFPNIYNIPNIVKGYKFNL
jgi:hypothetical protein